MPTYNAYGLALDSELPLPELLNGESKPAEVSLRIGEARFDGAQNARVLYKPLSSSEVIVHYQNVGTALVSGGSRITLNPAKNVDPVTLRLFVLQQALGVILLQRGFFVLHSAAAVVDGRAIGFAGASGAGKSTIVAALNSIGFPVLTDDVLAIDMWNPKLPMALPGLLQLKLTEDTRLKLRGAIQGEQAIGYKVAKKLCEVGAQVREPAPLRAIYFLESGERTEFTPAPPAKAAIELVRHTYGSHLLHAIDLSGSHFRQSLNLAARASLTLMTRPRDLNLLTQLAHDVVNHVRQQPPW